jgi:hypothetical protein
MYGNTVTAPRLNRGTATPPTTHPTDHHCHPAAALTSPADPDPSRPTDPPAHPDSYVCGFAVQEAAFPFRGPDTAGLGVILDALARWVPDGTS